MSDICWSIYIDIEGFGSKYGNKAKALTPLNGLMEGIFQIGTKKYNDNASRLFAHHFGDGFVIVSNVEEKCLDRPVAIAITLMRHVLVSGGVTKASIAEGGFSDIKDCYPEVVTNHEKNGCISMGDGLMTIIPVMGTALINAVDIGKRSPSGSLLIIDSKDKDRISPDFEAREIENGLHSINWLKGDQALVAEITDESELNNPSEEERIKILLDYIKQNKLKPSWVRTTCFEQGISI